MTKLKFELPPFLPTLTISSINQAYSVCKILKSANISFLEVTLRSSVSFEAIEYIANETNINIGLGTILHINQLKNFQNLKISFIVSPGFNDEVSAYCIKKNIKYIPGIETSTEIMNARKHDYNLLKFFPAEQAGGITKLKVFEAIFPKTRFMCTGGINLENYKRYSSLTNVCTVGGSFVLPKELVDKNNSDSAVTHLNLL